MNGLLVAFVSATCIFGGTLLGLGVRRLLPHDHLSADSKDAVKVGAGMISMMSALVLGLLVSSAKNNFDSANTALTESGAKVILMDRLLATYGPETREIRTQLRQNVALFIDVLWPEEKAKQVNVNVLERTPPMEQIQGKLRELKPQNESQRAILERAKEIAAEILLTRWVQVEQAQLSLPTPFLVILLFWLTLLYTSFGLLAPRNATVITVMFLGALALATAIFLIVEMSRPMGGAMKVSSAPMRKVLEHLGR